MGAKFMASAIYSKQITLSISKEMESKVDYYSATNGLTRSETLRKMIERGFEYEKKSK